MGSDFTFFKSALPPTPLPPRSLSLALSLFFSVCMCIFSPPSLIGLEKAEPNRLKKNKNANNRIKIYLANWMDKTMCILWIEWRPFMYSCILYVYNTFYLRCSTWKVFPFNCLYVPPAPKEGERVTHLNRRCRRDIFIFICMAICTEREKERKKGRKTREWFDLENFRIYGQSRRYVYMLFNIIY